ncbi:MAG: hypothetical protein GXY86_00235 [Firmicutes bacterium]|nr:hypothetical protein [Bacillota bacterium]
MLTSFFKKDSFIKDILLLLVVSILTSAVFARGFAMATDKYFAKAITGVMGDMGQYDLLFQTKVELKGALVRQVEQVIEERLPGASLKEGISIAGKASYFLTLPNQYKNKSVFNSLSHYFNNLPGNGGFTVMTEPRINISSVPSGAFDFLSEQVARIPGVRFTFKDGNSIGIILKNIDVSESVLKKIKQILAQYQILEVRLTSGYSQEEIMTLGKKVTQNLAGLEGADYVRDVTMAGNGDEYQYLSNTLLEVKKFLMAYAAEVKIQPQAGEKLEMGELLVLDGGNTQKIKSGAMLDPLQVVVKINSKDGEAYRGLIIQGDAGFISDNRVYRLLPEDKIGPVVGAAEVSSRKAQLVEGLDQGVKLLGQINGAINDFNDSTGGAGLTVSGIEKAYQQLFEVKEVLNQVESGIDGLTGKTDSAGLVKMVRLVEGIGDDLDYLARTFARVQVLENRFSKTLDGLQNAQILLGSPLLQSAAGQSGGIADKISLLEDQLGIVHDSLRGRVQTLDDFINRFNPLVATLLTWRNKANSFAAQVNNFGTIFTPGSANQRQLVEMIQATDQVLSTLTGFNPKQVKSGLKMISDHLFGSDRVDLTALIVQVEKFRDALPQLLDEEIGNSVNLIDKYVDGESTPGERLQIFINAEIDKDLINAAIRDTINSSRSTIYSLPVGTIQPDIRGELFKILAEVRSTIAALVVMILWVLIFILDQSLIISMLKMMDQTLLPKRRRWKHPWIDWGYRKAVKALNLANLYATAVGGVWLGICFALAGAKIPYLNYWKVGVFGGLLGALMSSLAVKINPISKDEVMAGLSLGLPYKTIMREIVIPAGRPGVLQFLNRWKMIMK